MNPQNFQENFDFHWEIQTPNPVRRATEACLSDAAKCIQETWASSEPYNQLTESFEDQREACRQEMSEIRNTLSNYIEKLLTTPFEEMSSEELQEALAYTQEKYNDLRWWRGTRILHSLWLKKTSSVIRLWDIDNQTEVNIAQEKIIDLLYWENLRQDWYDSENVFAFNAREWGNQVIKIPTFEGILQSSKPSEWNSLALVNYFRYLESQEWGVNLWVILKKIPASQVIALWELWKDAPNWPAMQYFSNNDQLKWIVEDIWVLDFNYLLKNLDTQNLKLLSELFDSANEDDKTHIQERIRNTISDTIATGDDINYLKSLAWIQSLGSDDNWIFIFIQKAARTWVLAKEWLDSFEILFDNNSEWTWAGPDVMHMIRWLFLTVLNWRWVWESWELEFNFEGINLTITEFNQENGTSYPVLGNEFTRLIRSIFSSETINWDYLERIRQLSWINQEIKSLQLQLSWQVHDWEKAYIRRQIERIRMRQSLILRDWWSMSEESANIVSRIESIHNTLDFTEQWKALSQASIRYIMENPRLRISRIRNISQILDVFEIYWSTLSNITLNNLHSSIIWSTEVISRFPWKIDSDWINILKPEAIANPDVMRKILGKNIYMLWLMIWKISNTSQQTKDLFYTSLIEISQEHPIPSEYRNSILNDYRDDINFSERQYGQSFSTEEVIGLLQSWVDLETNQIRWIKSYLRNADTWSLDLLRDSLMDLVINNPEKYSELIQGLRWREKYKEFDLILVRNNPQEFSKLPLSFRWNWDYIEALLKWLNNYWEDINDIIGVVTYIEITSWSVVVQLLRKFEESDLNLTSFLESEEGAEGIIEFIDKALNAFDNLDFRAKERVITNEDQIRTLLFFQRLKEYSWIVSEIWNENEEIQDQRSEIIDSSARYHYTFDFLITQVNNSSITEAQSLELMNILESSTNQQKLITEFTKFLILNGIWENDIQPILEWLLENLLEDNRALQNGRIFIPEWSWSRAWHLEEINWDIRPSENLRNSWEEFLTEQEDEIGQLSSAEIIMLFLRENNITEEDPNFEAFQGFFQDEYNIVMALYTRDNISAFREAVSSWNTEDFWNQARQAYFSWEISSQRISSQWKDNWENTDTVLPENWEISNLPPSFRERISSWNNGRFILKTVDWDRIPVTREDIGIIYNNERAEDNLVFAYQTFKEIWFERIWEHKDPLITVLSESDMSGQKFNIRDGEYIDRRELNILLSKILYITTQDERYKSIWLSLEDTQWNIRSEINGVFWEENTRNVWEAENRIVESYMNNFTERNRWDAWRPRFEALKQALRWEMGTPPESNDTEFVWV